MAKIKTTAIFGSNFTTHPITGHESNGEPSALKAAFDMLRDDYGADCKIVLGMQTYYNSGYNSATDKYEGEKEFGIEVEWIPSE